MNAKGDPGEERPHQENDFNDCDQEKNEKFRHGVNHRTTPRTKTVRVLKGIGQCPFMFTITFTKSERRNSKIGKQKKVTTDRIQRRFWWSNLRWGRIRNACRSYGSGERR